MIANAPISLDAAIEDMVVFAGGSRSVPSKWRRHEIRFGGARPSYNLDDRHIRNFYASSKANIAPTFCFPDALIVRWQLMAALIVQRHVEHGSLGPDVDVDAGSALGALVGFPLLERVAQLWTGAWDDHGRLVIDIPEEVGLLSPQGSPKSMKAGARLSRFDDRMNVLRSALRPDLRGVLDAFDEALARPALAGGPIAPRLFTRMAQRRNAWAHGAAFEEGEAYLLGLLAAFLYSASNAVSGDR